MFQVTRESLFQGLDKASQRIHFDKLRAKNLLRSRVKRNIFGVLGLSVYLMSIQLFSRIQKMDKSPSVVFTISSLYI